MRILSLPCATDCYGRKFIRVDGKYYRRSHLVIKELTGRLPDKGLVVDHINGDVSDDRPENLRVVSQGENLKNQKLNRTNTSGHMGVHRHHNGRFYARIKVSGEVISLGAFSTFEEAVGERKQAEAVYGFHENHGRSI